MTYFKRFAAAGIGAALAVLFLFAPLNAAASDTPPASSILPEGCMGQMTDDQVVIYYFTRKFHCQSCETVERTLLETVQGHYAEPFSDGRLAMCVINVDDPVNHHFLDEFGIISNSIFLIHKEDGTVLQPRNLADVWKIAQDPDAISYFLENSLDEYMAEADRTGPGPEEEMTENTSGVSDEDSGNYGSNPKEKTRNQDPWSEK